MSPKVAWVPEIAGIGLSGLPKRSSVTATLGPSEPTAEAPPLSQPADRLKKHN